MAPPPDQPAYAGMDLLRIATAGSVDDGKSTLIGRLLYDTKSIFEDQLAQIEGASRRLGESSVNLALLTDGLRAEREQKITIDVAYRYFATPRRKFILADTPGHVQYTRNMVTGASTADVAIVLVDAQKGVLTQSRRHSFIASLLGIPHVIVAVNKMDLVGFSEAVFRTIVADYTAFADKLTVADITFVPISALDGDNVVAASPRTPWYQGGPLLHLLESIIPGRRRNTIDFRFPVQYVVRPNQSFRGYAGTVASGSVRVGDELTCLPSGVAAKVRAITTFDGVREEAVAGDAVTITLDTEIDVARGDMLARRKNQPTVADRFDAFLCWMNDQALEVGRGYVVLHTSREVQAYIDRIEYRVDVDTMHREPAERLGLNEIGRVQLVTANPLCFDSYRVNSATGSFVVVDPRTNVTVAAGMIRGETRHEVRPEPRRSPNVTWDHWNVPRPEREQAQGHAAGVIWLTGLSGAGKSTIARAVERQLFSEGYRTMLLDGDQLRHGLNGDLGFSPSDRAENVRRAGEVARLFFEAGHIVLCTFVSPFARDRDAVRGLFPPGRFAEIYVKASVSTLRARDVKGLYARESTLSGLTAYEPPEHADLTIDTDSWSIETAIASVMALVKDRCRKR
ncbi:MAG TPA: sulfate adenylyltransferase subunit CysN [Vicinamibacterales bacterium]|nr:sulfate adenylyltransferase subunit CysN [Vicinamibacterales bacterium]